MRRLYFLLQRVVDGLPNTANTFQVYLTESGSKIVQEQKKLALKEALNNAIQFVKNLMSFYEKYYALVQTCFSNHTLFKTALDKVFYIRIFFIRIFLEFSRFLFLFFYC